MVAPEHDQVSASDINAWLTSHVARYCDIAPSQVDPTVSLADYGMDSYYAVTLTGDIEEKFGLATDPTLIWDNPTIDALTTAIVKEMTAKRAQ